ncbi:MAG: GrpB family protein [Nanoarchaeota archaeon]|nr:GrpB family protein [Nanoarchaeota archaeon]
MKLRKLRGDLEFRPYSNKFPKYFRRERAILKRLGEFDIYHIGSSAIPNMPGKGIIDILILVRNQKQKITLNKKLKKIGYLQGKTKEKGRSFFWRVKSGQEYGIHIMLKNNKKAKHQVKFRDYLIKNPKEFKRYLGLKKENFKKSKGDWKTYKEMKINYFKQFLKKRLSFENKKRLSCNFNCPLLI